MGMLVFAMMGTLLAQIGAPTAGQSQTNIITSIQDVLRAGNPQALHGRRVEWSGVEVQRVFNSEVVLVGTREQQVVLHRAETKPPVVPGDIVDVTGILNQMPATTQGWDIPGKDVPALRGQTVFVNVLSLQVRKHPREGASRRPSTS